MGDRQAAQEIMAFCFTSICNCSLSIGHLCASVNLRENEPNELQPIDGLNDRYRETDPSVEFRNIHKEGLQ